MKIWREEWYYAKRCNHIEISLAVTHPLALWSSNPILRYLPKENENLGLQKDVLAPLFIITNNSRHKYPSTVVDNKVLLYLYHWVLISDKKEQSLVPKQLAGISKALCYVKDLEKRLSILWFHLQDILGKKILENNINRVVSWNWELGEATEWKILKEIFGVLDVHFLKCGAYVIMYNCHNSSNGSIIRGNVTVSKLYHNKPEGKGA